jgi:hypothetical protein
MNEKVRNLFKGDNLKGFSKKIFTKKKIGAAVAVIVFLAAAKIGYSLAFEVNGTVLKVDSNSIVVANFLGTKTVNMGDYPINSSRIVVGQKIEITKNLSGQVISVKSGRDGRGGDNNRLAGQSVKNGKFAQGQRPQQEQNEKAKEQNKQARPSIKPGQGSADDSSGASVK